MFSTTTTRATMIVRLLILFINVLPSFAFKSYAEPLKMANPNKDNVYVFDMLVTRKLSMSFYINNVLHSAPVDYDPSTQRWSQRDPNQLKDCYANFTMNPNTNAGDEANLDDVLLLDGQHKRVLTINGNTPGKAIVVPYNAEVLLKVHNSVLMDAITIHVHGIDKQGMWYMDGVAFVQQCPIQSTN
uniref:Plastocyanin-like domain-containing protein n=1 Tax=Heterorhabditis bacteriophora TaxID=37862 RepID=A0A1I7XQQ7_HETBA